MPDASTRTLTVAPGPREGTVRTDEREILTVPAGWALLPPGDTGLTRRVKAGGPCWTVKEPKGRRMFSRGVWAPAERIEAARRDIERTRGTPEYKQRLAGDRRRREAAQEAYVAEFEGHVRRFLSFHPSLVELERDLARAVAKHSTPVGSGTVARTKRIPVAQRAEGAVIAWLRHQTTAYDDMHIERVKGRRREVRRELARASRELLRRCRGGDPQGARALSRALETARGPSPEAHASPGPKRPAAPPGTVAPTPTPTTATPSAPTRAARSLTGPEASSDREARLAAIRARARRR